MEKINTDVYGFDVPELEEQDLALAGMTEEELHRFAELMAMELGLSEKSGRQG